MQEGTIRIPVDSRMSERAYKGIPVKEAFYTAPYLDGDKERYLGPMNHAETYVLDSHALQMEHDVLLRTGNGIISLLPQALSIESSAEEPEFRVYKTRKLSSNELKKLSSWFNLLESYESTKLLARQLGYTSQHSLHRKT